MIVSEKNNSILIEYLPSVLVARLPNVLKSDESIIAAITGVAVGILLSGILITTPTLPAALAVIGCTSLITIATYYFAKSMFSHYKSTIEKKNEFVARTKALEAINQAHLEEARKKEENKAQAKALLDEAKAYIQVTEAAGGAVDLAKVSEYYQKAAELNDPEAQYLLAECYNKGEGVEINSKKAVELMKLSCEGGYYPAQSEYIIYSTFIKVFNETLQKAEKGDIKEKIKLAQLYMEGAGCDKNREKGITLYEEAAEAGDASAQSRVGLSYYYGHDREKNTSTAKVWFEKAAAQGYETAQYMLKAIEAAAQGNKSAQTFLENTGKQVKKQYNLKDKTYTIAFEGFSYGSMR